MPMLNETKVLKFLQLLNDCMLYFVNLSSVPAH